MGRDFFVYQEVMVQVAGNGALNSASGSLSPAPGPGLWNLGLTDGSVQITPVWRHRDAHVDDFGPDVPADVLTRLAEVRVRMRLCHYDDDVLQAVRCESMGGALRLAGIRDWKWNPFLNDQLVPAEGMMAGAGTPLGNGLPVLCSGNRYIHLTLLPGSTAATSGLVRPWRFLASHLAEQPEEHLLGTSYSLVTLNFRCIPYVPLLTSGLPDLLGGSGAVAVNGVLYNIQEITSSGALLWDRNQDSP